MNRGPKWEQDQSFGVLKVVSWSLLLLILASFLFVSIFLANQARQAVLAKQREFALLLAENLNHQIYQRFVLPTVLGFGGVELKNKDQYERLDKVVQSTVHSFHIMQVRIYDLDKVVSYSTDPNLVGQDGLAGESVEMALRDGHNNFELVSRGDSWRTFLLSTAEPQSVVLRTFYALRVERNLDVTEPSGAVMGVLEFVQDISGDYQSIVNLQRLIILTALGFSIALFLVLRMLIKRADQFNSQRIKERERLERELNQHEKLASMGRMVAGIAHEIRNPLGIIRSSAELLIKKSQDLPAANVRLLTAIFEEAKRLSKTVGDFLDYARPKAPRLELVDLSAILDQALMFLEPRCEELGVRVERDYQAGLKARGDKDLIYRAVYNILSNSLDALAESPPEDDQPERLIRASGQVLEGRSEIILYDSGPGFAPEASDKVLDPFFTTKESGTGLGLAIVASILESHGASLTLSNREEGGAKVDMIFPKV